MKLQASLKSALWILWPVLILLALGVFRMLGGEKYAAGKSLYTKHCASCHMEDGTGLRAVIPPLAKADYVLSHAADMACLIKYGMAGEITVNGVRFNRPMYGQPEIKDVEIRNIINYIKNSWGNEGEELSFQEVKDALKACEGQKMIPPP